MNNKIKVLIGIAVAVLIPLSLFILAKQMSKDRVLLPGRYNVENVIDEGDTMYLRAKDIRLVNQLGDTLPILAHHSDKAIIISVFDFSAQSARFIDSAERNIRVMQKSFLKKVPERFHFISIIMHNDSIDTRVMGDRVKADHDRWWFVTGDSASLAAYYRTILPQQVDIKERYFNDKTVPMVLIDTARHYRGYYDALDPTSLKKCADDAVLVILEKKKKR